MARKRRIEYPGAVYHVISRGNYRKELFLEKRSGVRFEETLFEAISSYGWVVYAYVIMSNHYHLAVRTPQPNLVGGMKWLQSTFATRFNRFRNEQGHVFQGRYKAILVEPDRSLLGLINYIHLNPVRAKICELEDLRDYKLSSYPKFWKRVPPEGLDRTAMLAAVGASDNLKGMRRYAEQLEVSEAKNPKLKKELLAKYCRGWFIGSDEAKAEMANWLTKEFPQVKWDSNEYKELIEAQWEQVVHEGLQEFNKTEQDLKRDLKGANWKVEIAVKLRKDSSAINPWIAQRLNMGHPSRISNLLREARNV